jgi:uncharacterized protein (UPF0276 family)
VIERSRRPAEAPFLGVGVGLRPRHYPEILAATGPAQIGVDFFEAISENYMVPGGNPLRVLERVRSRFPLVLHGVSMNVGSADPIDSEYVSDLAALAARFEPMWISDHLCWTGVGGRNLHDLLPLPYTETAASHVAERVARVQERLGRRIALENVSSYFAYREDSMPEWEFLARIIERADCGILLDVNNVFVSAHNHGFDPHEYLAAIPSDRVFQIHLAGHRTQGELLIDTHDHPVRDEVWALYETVIRNCGPVSTLIEWDDHIPELMVLAAEARRAREIITRCVEEEIDGGALRLDRRGAAPDLAAHHEP